jgi:hypothetical protein
MEENSNKLSEAKLSIWLQFFRAYQILATLVIPTIFAYEFYVFLSGESENHDGLLEAAARWPGFFFALYILKILPKRDSSVPSTIKSCVEWEIVIVSLLSANPVETVYSYIPYYLISHYYFINSKRVREYYGKNALKVYYEEIPLFYKNFRG